MKAMVGNSSPDYELSGMKHKEKHSQCYGMVGVLRMVKQIVFPLKIVESHVDRSPLLWSLTTHLL